MRLAYIIGTYPSLTITFIDREIRALRSWGVDIQVISIRRPHNKVSVEQDELKKGVIYILPASFIKLFVTNIYFILTRPVKYFGTLFYLLSQKHRNLKLRMMTFLHFLEGVVAADELRTLGIQHLHAHFVDRAATVALVAGRLLNLSYSLTAHARDIYVDPVLLPEKLTGAQFVATCTAYNKNHLAEIINGDEKIKCIYHGMDVERYVPNPRGGERALILSVGQLREKKGFPYLFEACRLLKEMNFDFHCDVIGEGPLRNDLQQLIDHLDLGDVVTLLGANSHEDVIRKYEEARLFVLPAVPGADGDRDGIPNVILEALAMELPVISTHHSGIPEVIVSDVNGLLVPVADAPALANAIAKILKNPELGRTFGALGRKKVLDDFSIESNVGQLLKEFKVVVGEG